MDDRANGGATAILSMVGIVTIIATAAYIFATPKDAVTTSSTLQLSSAVPIDHGVAYNVTTNVSGLSWDRVILKLAGATGDFSVGVSHGGKLAAVDSGDWKGTIQYQSKTSIVKGDQIVLTSKTKQAGALLVVMQASDQTVLLQMPVNGLGG